LLIIHTAIPDFETIVKQHQDRVLNICFKFSRNREDAEDTAQEVFIKVFRSLDKFKGDSKLSTWIFRIAVSKSLDAIRKKKRKKRFSSVKQILGIDENFTEPEGSADLQPDRILENKEDREILNKAISKLPDNQRIALILSQLDGFSYKETAAVMETTVASIESLIFRARKGIKKHLSSIYKINRK